MNRIKTTIVTTAALPQNEYDGARHYFLREEVLCSAASLFRTPMAVTARERSAFNASYASPTGVPSQFSTARVLFLGAQNLAPLINHFPSNGIRSASAAERKAPSSVPMHPALYS
jgi:hypothetical protein